jgi:hypothetical protein
MPDMERVIRSLELHTCKTAETKEYTRGFHAGLDKARWQIARLVVGAVIGWFIIALWVWCLT